MTSEEFRQKLELQIVELVRSKLADGSLTEDRSQELSKHVLSVIKPGMTFEELYKAIPKLDDMFPELSGIVLPLLKDYEKKVTQRALGGISDYIKQGQYDAAIKLGKDAANQDVKLKYEASARPPESTSTKKN